MFHAKALNYYVPLPVIAGLSCAFNKVSFVYFCFAWYTGLLAKHEALCTYISQLCCTKNYQDQNYTEGTWFENIQEKGEFSVIVGGTWHKEWFRKLLSCDSFLGGFKRMEKGKSGRTILQMRFCWNISWIAIQRFTQWLRTASTSAILLSSITQEIDLWQTYQT